MNSVQRFAPHVARVLLGLVFFVFGLNFFLHFLPVPTMPERGAAFAGALFATGYMFQLVKVIEVVAGALLVANFFVPLALTVLAPIVVNIVLFHTVLAPGNPLAFVIVALELYLAWSYRAAFAPMLAAKVAPASVRADGPLAAAPRAEA